MTPTPQALTVAGVDFGDLKAGLRRLLTYAKPVAALTPTPIDDAAIRLIELLLADDTKLAAVAVH